MWKCSPETSTEEAFVVGPESEKRANVRKRTQKKSIHFSVVLWPGKHLPIVGVQMPDLWSGTSGTSGSSLTAPLSSAPLVHPKTLAGVEQLAASLRRQGRSFKMTHSCCLPIRPAGQQELSSICCPLHTMLCPLAPAPQWLSNERKTPVSEFTDISQLQDWHTTCSQKLFLSIPF